jgi:hypothetical protein
MKTPLKIKVTQRYTEDTQRFTERKEENLCPISIHPFGCTQGRLWRSAEHDV